MFRLAAFAFLLLFAFAPGGALCQEEEDEGASTGYGYGSVAGARDEADEEEDADTLSELTEKAKVYTTPTIPAKRPVVKPLSAPTLAPPLVEVPPATHTFTPRTYAPSYLATEPEEDSYSASLRSHEREEARQKAQTVADDLSRLKRNASWMDPDEFARKAKRIEWGAEDASSSLSSTNQHGAASSVSDSALTVRRVRREVESEPSYFYRERENEIGSKLRRATWDAESAAGGLGY